MGIKKGNTRITVTLDPESMKTLKEIKRIFKCKNNSKAIKWLITIHEIKKIIEK